MAVWVHMNPYCYVTLLFYATVPMDNIRSYKYSQVPLMMGEDIARNM